MKRMTKSLVRINILLFVGVFFLISISSSQIFPSQRSFSNAKLLEENVKYLCAVKPPRSAENPESMKKVAEWIKGNFKSYGLKSSQQLMTVDGNQYSNVISVYGDKTLPILVIGAHYDSYAFGQMENPGADDNASGVAGLLEIARILQLNKPKLPFCIEFVAFVLEEPPHFGTEKMGSYFHAKELHSRKHRILSMISLEMIGFYSDEADSQEYPLPALNAIYPTVGNFIAIIGNLQSSSLVDTVTASYREQDIPVESIKAIIPIAGMDFSDHRNYWKFNWPAIMISDTAFYRNPNYHKATDTPDTLNYAKMAKVVDGLYAAIMNIKP